MARTLLQLGRDHTAWGEFSVRATGRSAVAMSVGADPDSPSLASKGDPDAPNEDAIAVVEEGERTLLAVADAHHGLLASEMLIGAIARRRVPADFAELCQAVADLDFGHTAGTSTSTFLVAVVDRSLGIGFGLSYGDGSLVSVDGESARVLNVRVPRFLAPGPESPIDPEEAQALHFFVRPGALVVAHTDGVNECHYRSPRTSIGPSHLLDLFRQTGPDPEAYARALVELALDGVDGHPGGQDNVGIVVTATAPGARP